MAIKGNVFYLLNTYAKIIIVLYLEEPHVLRTGWNKTLRIL